MPIRPSITAGLVVFGLVVFGLVVLGLVVLGLVVLGLGAHASAATVLDVDQPDSNTVLGSAFTTGTGQTFVPTANNIADAGFIILSGPDITVSLYDVAPGDVATASPLVSVTVNFGGATGDFIDVFWSPVAVTPGETYFLHVSSTSNLATLRGFGSAFDTYTDGQAYQNFAPLPGFTQPADFAFRTYTDDAFSSTVPVPASLPLLLAAFGGLAACARTHRLS